MSIPAPCRPSAAALALLLARELLESDFGPQEIGVTGKYEELVITRLAASVAAAQPLARASTALVAAAELRAAASEAEGSELGEQPFHRQRVCVLCFWQACGALEQYCMHHAATRGWTPPVANTIRG